MTALRNETPKKTVAQSSRRRVALLIETSRGYGRGTLLGVAKYIRERGPWSIFLQEQIFCDDLPDWIRTWEGDGLITRVENPAMATLTRRLGVPAVFLRDVPATLRVPCVITDHVAVGRYGFAHLRERGFRHYAFCGFNGAEYSDARRDSFVESVRESGLRCHVFGGEGPPRPGSTTFHEARGSKDGPQVARWIKRLPKPIGLMACNDFRGQQVLTACRAAGVPVPDEVAVIGVDNDEVLCDLSDPPLSSVVPNKERIGYEAAALLDRLMSGEKPAQLRLLIEPTGIVTRRSTEVLAIEDRRIAAAARFIRERACEGIGVDDVVRAVGCLSRSTLERRYVAIMGCSPKQEILRVRVERAKQLLAETVFPVAAIAERLGLEHTEYLNVIFKRETGVTPAQFRARSRAADAADRLPGGPEDPVQPAATGT
jgi:LacI family transcriptional regulator